MQTYSILLLKPDFTAANFGQETVLKVISAANVARAISFAQRISSEAYASHVETDPADWFVLLACEGEIQDINPHNVRPLLTHIHGR